MELQLRTRRWIAAGVATLAGGAGLMVMLPASAQSVEPELVEGNPTCADISPEGTEWTSLKVDPAAGGEHSDGVLTVNITINETEEGQTFDWNSNIGVQAVIAKGGPNANVYFYGSSGSTGDSGLHAPAVPSEDWADLSHIDFCYTPPTPTTPPPTTAPPTTAPPTTPPPTTAPPTTPPPTAPGETTTTQPSAPAPAPRAPAAVPPAPVVAQPSVTG